MGGNTQQQALSNENVVLLGFKVHQHVNSYITVKSVLVCFIIVTVWFMIIILLEMESIKKMIIFNQ